MTRYSLRLSAEDWVLIGYIAGLLVWFIADTLAPEDGDTTAARNEQEVTLTEDDLRRIEDGDTVKLRRWHGHELVLGGGMVIDADQIDVEEGDPDR